MKNDFHITLWSALLLFTVMWLSSYTHHTAVGIDHDQQLENQTIRWFHRINWNGHGSLWIGYGTAKRPDNQERALEKYDPAAVFFQRSRPITVEQSFWNRLGFWYITGNEAKKTFWIGIPSWLPVLILAALIFLLKRRHRAN